MSTSAAPPCSGPSACWWPPHSRAISKSHWTSSSRFSRRRRRPAMSVASRLADLFREGVGVDLPVRLCALGSREAGPRDTPVLIIRNRRALRRLLWAPGELGLARAYVTGDLDIEGDPADGLRRSWRLAGDSTPRLEISVAAKARAALSAARLGVIGLPPKPPSSEAR